MPTNPDPMYLTIGRFLVWVAASLVGTALALVDGYYFHSTIKTYWTIFIPLQVSIVIPAILYVGCSTPRSSSFCYGLLKLIQFTFWQINIQMLQYCFVTWVAKGWILEMATLASLDVLFVFSLGLNIWMLADYTAVPIFTQPVQFHWERAEMYLGLNNPSSDPSQRGSNNQKAILKCFFNRIRVFHVRFVIVFALTQCWIPILLFAPMNPETWNETWKETWKAMWKNPRWSEIGYALLLLLGYPLAFACPLLVWKCQVGQECRLQDGQEPKAEEV
ncbi:hypothetical protein E2P81_ATG04279 [Venturia nashicola]|nr:hypothetical protein E2P81_ATG04279 [Venturia nashicola]